MKQFKTYNNNCKMLEHNGKTREDNIGKNKHKMIQNCQHNNTDSYNVKKH